MFIFVPLAFISIFFVGCFGKKQAELPQKIRSAQYLKLTEEYTPGYHFLSRFGHVKYNKSFQNFAYVNPNAPQGGTLRLATVGTFDKVNYFLLKGFGSGELAYQFDRLMCEAGDEAYTKYGLVAKTCEVAADASWVKFYIRPQARFHDGSLVTARSIAQTIRAFKQDGILPLYKRLYQSIAQIDVEDDYTLTLHLTPDSQGKYDRLKPLFVANIIPVGRASLNHLTDNRLTPIVGSGPYIIKNFKLGQSLHFTKNIDYWAQNLPVNRGKWNFDDVTITYFKNDRALIEAFKKGDFDIFFVTNRQQFDAFVCPDHRFTKLNFKHKRPVQVQTITMNLNNPILQDQRVRDALNFLLSFKDINHVCFGNTALHARSLFENTGLGHKGPPDDMEKKVWVDLQSKSLIDASFWGRLMDFDVGYFVSGTKESRLKQAEDLLEDAGYVYDKNLGCRAKSPSNKLEFDLIVRQSKSKYTRFLNIFKNDLEKIGVKLNILILEENMYRQKEDSGQYDMIIMPYNMSLSPSVELLDLFGKMQDKIVEELIAGIINSTQQETLASYTKALDRYLCMRGYMILLDFNNSLMMIYRNDRIDFPKNPNADINIWERGWSVQTPNS